MHTHVKNKLYGEGYRTRFAVGFLVLILHGALIYALWRARPNNMPDQSVPVFVRLLDVTPPVHVKKKVTPSPHPSPQKQHGFPQAPAPQIVRTEAPDLAPIETIAPSPMTMPGPVAAEPSPSLQVAPPIGLASDLSLSCPVRTAPTYPALARKMGETGSVVLRVALDETGQLVSPEVAHTSGYPRLDQAALIAVKNWRCNPAMRDGQAVPVISMESFDFKLTPEGY